MDSAPKEVKPLKKENSYTYWKREDINDGPKQVKLLPMQIHD
jgi:hypothetical protein